jgi:hypothetical protein
MSSHPSSPSISQISLEEVPTVNSPVYKLPEPQKHIQKAVEQEIVKPKPKPREVKIIPREICEKF